MSWSLAIIGEGKKVYIFGGIRPHQDKGIARNIISSDHTVKFLDHTTNGDLPRILKVPGGY
jgi:hypothetical protein